MTQHQIHYTAAQQMPQLADESVHLVVTSPPYPMIAMWDDIMSQQNTNIAAAFEQKQPRQAFELMHRELDKVWAECYRVLCKGGIACINIGDATRTLHNNFQLFANHARIIEGCLRIGFQNLPNIIWRKPTNAPNKFMGSGMLPPGAYVTLEHEFILLFRKGNKRLFKTEKEKENRRRSAFFWEERNVWFSDLWEVLGTQQRLMDKETRQRSAAFPLEIAHRLVNMFSVQGDVVLDPFLGTGTTALAAMANARNSIGYEIDAHLQAIINDNLLNKTDFLNKLTQKRIAQHLEFIKKRKAIKGEKAFKYMNEHYNFEVITKQEQKLILLSVKAISKQENGIFNVTYS